MYDYLIVGAGLFGSVCARELTNKGFNCLVIDKRNHIAGNCYTKEVSGINVHKYGPHIFHTNSQKIWNYINQYSEFNNFIFKPKVKYKDKIYSFPINLFTLYQLFSTQTPEQAINKLNELKLDIENPNNLEDWVLNNIGQELYEIFIKGYTTKQWNKSPKELPSSIIRRIPIRTNFNDNYFDDIYQGIPIDGYTSIFEKLLEGIEVKLETDFFQDKQLLSNLSNRTIYTGAIDEFFEYKYGYLEYRSLKFEEEVLNIKDYQGCAVINYTEENIPYTRIVEHKHFNNISSENTIITKEYPQNWDITKERFYPINTESNNKIFEKYKSLETDVIFGGRLAEYKYYDMHQVIASALSKVQKLLA